jgi:hypothetical protein
MADLADPGFQRSAFEDNDLVCYCFPYTKKQIEED